MVKGTTHQFWIDSFTPDTLPMERLAQYMLELAKLLGEPENVQFVEVSEGSAILKSHVRQVALPKVVKRIEEVQRGEGDPVALKAFAQIDKMLVNDNAIGQLQDSSGAEMIVFPGRTRPKPMMFGPFREDGSLEGVVIKLGGKDETVPVHLQERAGVVHKCNASKDTSKKLAPYYLNGFLRVHGSGRWLREETGVWRLIRFDIKDFEILDETPLVDVVRKLQAVQGADWGDDPEGDLLRLRLGEVAG